MPPKTPRQSLGSAATPTSPFIQFSFQDIVLAKVKGHPAWPARIIDPHTAPNNLRDERKIAQKNSFLVKFFKTADYAWMNSKEMSKLGPSEIKAFIDNPNKKGADLKAAYQIALHPDEWEAEIENELRSLEQEYDELEPTNEGEIEMDSPEPVKKRKRNSEPKPKAKTPKKRKSDVVVTNGSAPASATPEPVAVATPAKKGRKKKEEPAVVINGEVTVRDWRHRLQRAFLGKSDVTEKMMPDIDEVFKSIEAFEMKTEWLTSSKLGKVLKRVGVLDDSKVPLDEKYNIRARARALQEKWRRTLGIGDESASRAATTAPVTDVKSSTKSLANGGQENKENTQPVQVSAENSSKTEASLPEAAPQDEAAPPEKDVETEDKMEVDPPSGSELPTEPQAPNGSSAPAEPQETKDEEMLTKTGTAVVSNEEEEKDDDTKVKDQEKSDVKAAEGRSDEEEEIKEDGEKMDCSDSPQPETTEAGESSEAKK